MSYLRTAVVMAGGEGVRLRPLTYGIPKPLLPVGPYTVLEHLVKRLADQGVTRVEILASYRFERFEEAVSGYAERYGIEVGLRRETTRLGTIGGLSAITGGLTEPFLLVNADLVLEADFNAMHGHHVASGAWMTVGVKRYTDSVPYGVVHTTEHGRLLAMEEKPSHEHLVSVGAYILSPEVLSYLDGSRSDVPDVIARLLAEDRPVSTWELEGMWLDVGQADDYERAARLLDDVEREFE